MMFWFYADTEDVTDEADNLVGVIVRWSQEDEEASQAVRSALRLTTAALLVVAMLMSTDPREIEELKMAAGGLAAFGVLILLGGYFFCTDHHRICFAAEGCVTMPRGLIMNWLRGPYYLGRQQEISSIQIQAAERSHEDRHKQQRYEVWIYYEDGTSFSVAESLFKPQAHRVVVSLERALSMVRDARAQQAVYANRAWAEAVLD
jgi:hypothetical protein